MTTQNSPRVSDEKRLAVLEAVAESGYRPDPAARSPAERRTRTVFVVIDDLSDPTTMLYHNLLAMETEELLRSLPR